MIRTLLCLATMLWAQGAMADCKPYNKFQAECSSGGWSWLEYSNWTVIKGSETYTLDEFISSGRMCLENGGHRWLKWNEWDDAVLWSKFSLTGEALYTCSNLQDVCVVCHRCRQKVKVPREVEEWEK